MNRNRYSFISLAALLILALSSESQAAALKNISPRPHNAAAGMTLQDLSYSIVHAAGEMQWFVVTQDDKSVTVSINVRNKHDATVLIGFDDQNFWIDYVDSKNLDYNPIGTTRRVGRKSVKLPGPRIHKNYNRWIELLANRIALRARNPVNQMRAKQSSPIPLLIADELKKLAELRDQGILTNDEFEKQKARLLDQ